MPHAAACSYVSLSVPGRQFLQKPPPAITAGFSVRQELQWDSRGLATETQPNTEFEKLIVPLLRAL